jgi:prepilin-type N-terminal cleavage/methylation domain-containing protein
MSTPLLHGRAALQSSRGFSLVEMLLALSVGSVVMGVTMVALTNSVRSYDSVTHLTSMNNTLRTTMDLMVRDFLQVGSGLPPGHVIATPSGTGSTLIRLPGPPGTAFTNVAGDTDIVAVVPGTGLGPTVNGVSTDVITVLMADNNFTDIGVTAVNATSVTVQAGVNVGAGPDRVSEGQLMMVSKGSFTTLVQVTTVNASTRVLTFAAGDSLNLNQPSAVDGSLAALNAAPPANTPANTRLTRVRMITYYIDATISGQPRLVRRVNNGHPTSFDNTLGTVVGPNVENLRISYDLADGTTNPADVTFTTADLSGTGACAPNPCSPAQVRKINVSLTARSDSGDTPGARVFRNTLVTQVSLRGMAFVNEYQSP